jgi:hypothetical protein
MDFDGVFLEKEIVLTNAQSRRMSHSTYLALEINEYIFYEYLNRTRSCIA